MHPELEEYLIADIYNSLESAEAVIDDGFPYEGDVNLTLSYIQTARRLIGWLDE